MPVTEIALLRAKAGKDWSSQEVLTSLTLSKKILEKVSGHTFHFLHGVEDPKTVYMHGGWDSIEAHVAFVTSPENVEMQGVMGPLATPVYAFHLDIDSNKTPLPVHAPTISLGRYFVKEGNLDEVETLFNEGIAVLENAVGEGDRINCGRRLDKGYEPTLEGEPRPEFTVITGWDTIQAHQDFAKAVAGNQDFQKLQKLLAGVEALHMTLLL